MSRWTSLLGHPLILTSLLLGGCDDDECASFFGVVGSSTDVAIGDLDGDGADDLVTANTRACSSVHRAGNVRLFRQSMPGDLVLGGVAEVGLEPASVAMGDLNGDGFTDLVSANFRSGTLSILLQDPALPGSFLLPRVDLDPGSIPGAVEVADLDNDTLADLIVAGDPGGLSVLLQDSTLPGTFLAPVPVDSVLGAFVVGDVDGDVLPDIVTTDGNGVSFFINDPLNPGSFPPATLLFPTGFEPGDLALGDVDGDSRPDLAVADVGGVSLPPDVWLLIQDPIPAPPGSFLPPVSLSTPADPIEVALDLAIGDLNNDNFTDIALLHPSSVSIVFQDASAPGSFLPRVVVYSNLSFFFIRFGIGEFSGDGLPDLAVAGGVLFAEGLLILNQDAAAPDGFSNPVILQP